MAGQANFPTTQDDDTSLYEVVDATTTLIAAHHNNIKEAIKAIEAKVGIHHTSSPTSLDYRIGSATAGHIHDGASGQGPAIEPSTILVPSGGFPSGLSLHDHLMDADIHAPPHHIIPWYYQGSLPSGPSLGAPFSFGRTMQFENIQIRMRSAPSGATTALDVNIGPTSLWQASQGNRPIFPAGSAYFHHASMNLVTYPSGALIAVDVDTAGSNNPGQDLSVVFTFRE